MSATGPTANTVETSPRPAPATGVRGLLHWRSAKDEPEEGPKPHRRQRRRARATLVMRGSPIPAGVNLQTSMCTKGCRNVFGARTTREAIEARKQHEADAHGAKA